MTGGNQLHEHDDKPSTDTRPSARRTAEGTFAGR
ncbi:hypothetical protein LCGC14_1742390, partial [marine sediment metagenome]